MGYAKHNFRQEYLRQSVMTATPQELVVMLFDSCIKNLKLAEICLKERRDLDGANAHLQKAQKIILELVNCLDTGFEISGQLLAVYDYLLRTIREINAKKDFAPMPDLLDMLSSMRDTWQKAGKLRCACSSEVG